MDGHLLEELAARQQVVDPQGAEALEDVCGGLDREGRVEGIDRRNEAVDELDRNGVLDDRVAVARDSLDVLGGVGARHPPSVQGAGEPRKGPSGPRYAATLTNSALGRAKW